MTRATKTRCQAGFTLVEVLVALALSALVSLILLNGIRLATTGLERQTRVAERLDTQQSLDDLLRRTLGSAALVPRLAGGVFNGGPSKIEFVGVAEDGGPGLYRIDLGIDAKRRDRSVGGVRSSKGPLGEQSLAEAVDVGAEGVAEVGVEGTVL